jgi:hypothetical protein
MGSSLKVKLDVLVRTLITAGFSVNNAKRYPTHIEIESSRSDAFGIQVPYVFALTDEDKFPASLKTHILENHSPHGILIVFIAQEPDKECLGWQDILDILGGAVPTWRALGPDYSDYLLITGKNQLPEGALGEAWQLFESAVADGLEYLLGHRVRQLGGKRRGQRVSDMVAQSSDETLMVIDAKASQSSYSVRMSDLRPLIEYVATQKQRQKGNIEVRSAIIVANEFQQCNEELIEVCAEFLSVTGVPLCCLTTLTLLEMIDLISKYPKVKNAVIWRKVFCKVGLAQSKTLKEEILAVLDQQVRKDSFK